MDAPTPSALIQRKQVPGGRYDTRNVMYALTEEYYQVLPLSNALLSISAADQNAALLRVLGFPARVRVIVTHRGQKKL